MNIPFKTLKLIESIKNWFLFFFVCKNPFGKGHKKEYFLYETKTEIYIRKCSRCNRFLEYVSKLKKKPYHFLSTESINNHNLWNYYCDKRDEVIREFALRKIHPQRLVLIEKTENEHSEKFKKMLDIEISIKS